MAKVTIGDKEYVIRELNFAAIEKAWETIVLTMQQVDPIQAVGSGLTVIAAALQEEPEFKREDFGIKPEEVLEDYELDARVTHFLKKQLKAGQIGNVAEAIDKIVEEAGLRRPTGESTTPGTLSPGTETLTQSLLNSLQPDAKVEAGIG